MATAVERLEETLVGVARNARELDALRGARGVDRKGLKRARAALDTAVLLLQATVEMAHEEEEIDKELQMLGWQRA